MCQQLFNVCTVCGGQSWGTFTGCGRFCAQPTIEPSYITCKDCTPSSTNASLVSGHSSRTANRDEFDEDNGDVNVYYATPTRSSLGSQFSSHASSSHRRDREDRSNIENRGTYQQSAAPSRHSRQDPEGEYRSQRGSQYGGSNSGMTSSRRSRTGGSSVLSNFTLRPEDSASQCDYSSRRR